MTTKLNWYVWFTDWNNINHFHSNGFFLCFNQDHISNKINLTKVRKNSQSKKEKRANRDRLRAELLNYRNKKKRTENKFNWWSFKTQTISHFNLIIIAKSYKQATAWKKNMNKNIYNIHSMICHWFLSKVSCILLLQKFIHCLQSIECPYSDFTRSNATATWRTLTNDKAKENWKETKNNFNRARNKKLQISAEWCH